MKKMLLAATAVGIATAGALLYIRKRTNGKSQQGKIGKDSREMNIGMIEAARPGQHTMG